MDGCVTKMRGIILVIDDDKFTRFFFTERVKPLLAGFEVIAVNECAPALLELHRREKDILLIVLDYLLPLVDGLEFLQILCYKYPNIPVLCISGSADDSIKEKLLNAGAVDFIKKPLDKVEVADRIHSGLIKAGKISKL